MRAQDVRRIWAYNRTVLERFLKAAERSPTRAATADRGIGHLSIKNTLAHILRVHEAWLVFIAQGRLRELKATRFRYELYPKVRDVRDYFDRVTIEIDRFIRQLRDSDLKHHVKAPWMPGAYNLQDAFLQTTIEQAHHLGEIIGAFWTMEREPPEMTWIDVDREIRATRGVRRSTHGAR